MNAPDPRRASASRAGAGHARALAAAAVLLFAAVSLPVAWVSSGDLSGWNLSTSPLTAVGGGSRNPVTAYCGLWGDTPFFDEHRPSIRQVRAFLGDERAAARLGWPAKRSLYAFAVSLLAPALGIVQSMRAVNWLAWAACAWVSWAWAVTAFRDRVAGLLAVLLTAGGTGMILHSADYGAHPLGFASYYAGAYLIFRSRVWCESRGWRTHLTLGAAFGLASLVYNSGLMLLATYLLVSFRRARPAQLAAALALGFAGPFVWGLELRAQNPGFVDVEYSGHFLWALQHWGILLRDPPRLFAWIGTTLVDLVLYENPLLVAVGLAGLVAGFARGGAGLLVAGLFGIPIAAALVFSTAATARGYLVYGTSVLLYVAAARLLSRGLRRPPPWRPLALASAALLLVSQFIWSTAHFQHRLGPAYTYVNGISVALPALLQGEQRVLSLTDAEPTPIFSGGTAHFAEAGAYTEGRWNQPRPRSFAGSFRVALELRVVFVAYLALLAALGLRRARPATLLAVVALFAVVGVAHAALCAGRPLRWPRIEEVREALRLSPGGELRYEVALGERFLAALRQETGPGDRIAIFVPVGRDVAELRASVGGAVLPLARDPRGYFVARDAPALLELLERTRRVGLRAHAGERPARLAAWQRSDLPGRELALESLDGAARPPRAPVLEIRVIDPRGAIKLIGF